MRWIHEKWLNSLIFKGFGRQKETCENRRKWLDKSSPKGWERIPDVNGEMSTNCVFTQMTMDEDIPF